MADQPVVHIGENSPEYVALQLTDRIFTYIEDQKWNSIDRQTFLDTYAECLNAVKGYRDFSHSSEP